MFGGWRKVVFEGNLIRRMRGPLAEVHNDAIQFLGNSSDVRIAGNRLEQSHAQLILIQDAVGGRNHDIKITGNVIWRADGYAVQSQGATGVRVHGNVIWGGRYGALLLRRSPTTGRPAHDTAVTGNLLDGFSVLDGAEPRRFANNYIARRTPQTPVGALDAPGAIFFDPAQGDLRLRHDLEGLRADTYADLGDPRWSPLDEVKRNPTNG
jgi:hypothetical protein